MSNKHSALRLVETRSLGREEWLQVRKGGIGSSDAASAVGLCPYRSQLELWMEKTGRSPGYQPAALDDPTYWGTQLEPLVASAYAERTGRKVRRINAVLQHPTFSFMLAITLWQTVNMLCDKADALPGGRHVGCQALRAFLDEVQPACCLSGHIHEAASRTKLGRTVLLNPGPFSHGNVAVLDL